MRIKRRRRDDHEALDALVIEAPARPGKRSKTGDDRGLLSAASASSNGLAGNAAAARKDVSTADPAQTGSARQPGIFRFAATVSTSAFASESSTRSLRDRITSLILHPPPRTAGAASSCAGTSGSSTPSRASKFSLEHDAGQSGGSGRGGASPAVLTRQEKERKQARYKIVQEKRSYASLSDMSKVGSTPAATTDRRRDSRSGRRPTAPPFVKSTARTESAQNKENSNGFKILTAAIESDSAASGSSDGESGANTHTMQKPSRNHARHDDRKLQINSRSSYGGSGRGTRKKTKAEIEEEEMMSNFAPMLQEYLSLSDPKAAPVKLLPSTAAPRHPSTPVSSRLQASSATASTTASSSCTDDSPPHPSLSDGYPPDFSSGDAGDSDSEYVYDVYYRDPAPLPAAPSSASAMVDAASFATTSGAAGGYNMYEDLLDVGSGAGLRRIGALSGLQDDDLLLDALDGESGGPGGAGVQGEDSDAVMTDDEDSNEEDFYRNDYPEGEGEGSDDMDEEEDDEDEDDDSSDGY